MRLFGFSLLTAGVIAAIFFIVPGIGGSTTDSMPVMQAAKASGDMPRVAKGHEPVAYVELFTSQGCSSCPPADKFAATLKDDPNVLVVSRPVTYWDRLGWKDTLAMPANDRLQRAYAKNNFANAGVYTPQMVINGRDGAIGSRRSEVRDLLTSAVSRSMRDSVDMQVVANGNGRTLKLKGKAAQKATVSVLALSRHESVRIGRGENGGRVVNYTNVLLDETPVGTWSGGNSDIAIGPDMLSTPGADLYAVKVQYGNSGEVVGAARL